MIPFSGGSQLSNGRRTGLGSGFGGVVAYLMHGRRRELGLGGDAADRVAWTATRNLPVEKPEHAALWMRAWANQNVRVKKPVYHFGVSLAPDEHLSREQWEYVVDRMLERLGLSEHQALIALHRDRDHEHIHIAVNRVGPDERVWKPGYDVFKQQDAARELERELGLRVVPTQRDLRLAQRKAHAPRRLRREIEKPFAERVRAVALEDFKQSLGWEELEERLARHGLYLEAAKRGGGVNVTDGHERAGVARIDRTLSGPRLAKRYGETFRAYRARRPDRPALERAFERPDVAPPLPLEVRAQNMVRHLSSKRATWSEKDVRRLSDRDRDGDRLLRQALMNDGVLSIGSGPDGEERFSSAEYLQAERGMFDIASRLAGRGDFQLASGEVSALLEVHFEALSHEQRDAVLHATTGGDLALVVGRAGAGKTRLTRAVVAAYQAQGYSVRGAALAGIAAEGLAAEAGIEARTLASYELAWQAGRGELTRRDVLIVDEAGMIDVRQMRRVLSHAGDRGAKIVLVGDPEQLKAIGAGDAFRGLIERHGAARVDTIRRQAQAWQREASKHLADGQLEPALSAYFEHGAIRWHTHREQARDALAMAYFEDRYLAPDQSSLILTYRNAEVRALNERIRDIRRAAGELGASVRLNGLEFSAGDRVLFLRNDHSGRSVRTLSGPGRGVKNGTLGTLVEVEPERLRIRLDSGRLVELDPRTYNRLAHGYAATIHKAQGVTVDRAYVLADRGFDRNLTYVALTRHRHRLRLYVDRETFQAGGELRGMLAREPRKDLALDYRAGEEAILGPPPLGGEPVSEGAWMPPMEPMAAAELTPRRFERLKQALGQLEEWDVLSSRLGDVARARSELHAGGSLPDLKREIAQLGRPHRSLTEDLERIYRRPENARTAILRHLRKQGPFATYRRLEDRPEVFGPVLGREVLRRPTRERAQALEIARLTGSRGLERHFRQGELVEAVGEADRYRRETLDLSRRLKALARGRDTLAEKLRQRSEGLDLSRLAGRLPASQLKTLKDLRQADELHLEPLRAAVESFHRAHRARRPQSRLLTLGRRLLSLYRATPRSLLKRLAPAQVRLLWSAVSAAAVMVEKLLPEAKDRDRDRREVLSPGR